ncbi:MAG TPA: SRPBCC family protein [Polyangiaceae bacterium]|nr:SRPBCC family protein [Polyangiaceae bacterium]
MVEVDRSILVATGPEIPYELLADPLRFPSLFSAFPRVELVSGEARREGVRYLVSMRIGHIDAGGVQRVTVYRPRREIAFESEGGVRVSGGASFRAIDATHTEVRLRLRYEVPGFRPAARVVESLTRHVVARHVEATLLSLRRFAEFDQPAWLQPGEPEGRDRSA